MKVLVTGVAGQLGHDVMNELAKRGYEGIGSEYRESYNGIRMVHRLYLCHMCRWTLQIKHL